MIKLPPAAVIEIVERGPTAGENPTDVVLPNEVRINGTPLLLAEDGIKIHEMKVPGDELVTVTLTVFARRVFIGAEKDVPVPARRKLSIRVPAAEHVDFAEVEAFARDEGRKKGATGDLRYVGTVEETTTDDGKVIRSQDGLTIHEFEAEAV
jgi:hypothetical protein